MPSVKAFVGLGANLGRPEAQVRRAIAALGEIPKTRLVSASSLYRSAPVGVGEQPDFINAVAEIETRLSALALLDELLAIEARFGRRRESPGAPRTLDLDLLLYGDEVVDEPGLVVPHPRTGCANIARFLPSPGRAWKLPSLGKTGAAALR